MSDRYAVTSLDELVGFEIPGQARWHRIRSTLDVGAFGINAWTATEDGQQIIGQHDESSGEGHEEVYVVLSGRATFTLDGESAEAPAGTVVHVADPTVERAAVGTSGTTILVVGAKRGEAFTPSTWERSSEALRYWQTEEWDEAIGVLEGHLADTPDHGGTHYNLACAHARAGRPEIALEHLGRAVELQPTFAQYAQTDDDLSSLREDPRFPAG
ncbi:MAG TPA: tetratricopeptide repeat protein [Gaiella sp.]